MDVGMYEFRRLSGRKGMCRSYPLTLDRQPLFPVRVLQIKKGGWLAILPVYLIADEELRECHGQRQAPGTLASQEEQGMAQPVLVVKLYKLMFGFFLPYDLTELHTANYGNWA